MKRNSWIDVIDEPFPPITVVTEAMQMAAFKQVRLMRGSIRLKLGRLSTSQELADRRRRAMAKDLI